VGQSAFWAKTEIPIVNGDATAVSYAAVCHVTASDIQTNDLIACHLVRNCESDIFRTSIYAVDNGGFSTRYTDRVFGIYPRANISPIQTISAL
jgi:hypothetical protein